ncbi:Vacuolar protein-sorting-associated protein 36, partial [Spiromyces aspiralis]
MDFVRSCDEMSQLDLGLVVWTYPGGFKVLRAATRGSFVESLAETVTQYVRTLGSISPIELAVFEECSVTLAMEHLKLVESQGVLCRDESVKEVRFYENLISGVATKLGLGMAVLEGKGISGAHNKLATLYLLALKASYM